MEDFSFQDIKPERPLNRESPLSKTDQIKRLLASLNEEEIPDKIKDELKFLFEQKVIGPKEPDGQKIALSSVQKSSSSKVDSQASTLRSLEARSQNMGIKNSPFRTHINVSDFLKKTWDAGNLFPKRGKEGLVTPTKQRLSNLKNDFNTSKTKHECVLPENEKSYKSVIGKIFDEKPSPIKKAPFFNKKAITKRENSEESIRMINKKESFSPNKSKSPIISKGRAIINKSAEIETRRRKNKSFMLDGSDKLEDLFGIVDSFKQQRRNLNKSMTELRQSILKTKKERDSSFTRKSLILNESGRIEKNSKRRKKSEGSIVRAIDKLKKEIRVISQDIQVLNSSNKEAEQKINFEQHYIGEMRDLIKEARLQIREQKKSNEMLKEKLKAGQKFLKILLTKEDKMKNLQYITTIDSQLKRFYESVKRK